MNYFVLLLFILIVCIVYFIYKSKKKNYSKKELLSFLHVLSQSFHEAKWIQVGGEKDSPPQVIAHRMNKVLRKNLEYELKSLLPKMYYFPKKGFVFPSEDEETNKFISKVFPVLRSSYERYNAKKSNLVSIADLFFKETEQVLLLELEKEYKHKI
jgi:hypothetical protein